MSKKYSKKKKLNRAYPIGNGLMYVPAGQQQGVLGQTFYGTSTANIPVGESALFSPGIPLAPQPNVNPKNLPVQWKFTPAVNTFPPDRTNGDPDIPSFQQLRTLAKLYNGITLCERAWMDMVPRMKLKVELKPEFELQGANIKDYQKEVTYFRNWFDYPDKMHDIHSWLRMCLREQTQIDELYIYKRKKRNGKLHALEIVSGDQMKPLLDDWGKIPQPPMKAYQQYPWGIPGAWFGTDEMIHYQESPAADTPYGQSRVERIIMLVNQALRKQKKDLSHFTEGNIPQGMMLVPDNAVWTPDQIDSFEQAWNALLAGNQNQQVRMRFTQPGMKYQPFEQYKLDPTFDTFIFKVAAGVYGVSMGDISFTEDIHKSSSDSQQNMLYRRTIDPLATVYAFMLTQIMNNEFDPDLHGDMFQVVFGGYDEEEDVASLATAYSTLTNAGILGLTNAAKLLKLPDDPDAPYIGRVYMTKDGPIFLDDMAQDQVRKAQLDAQLATMEQAQIQNEQTKTNIESQKQNIEAQKNSQPEEQTNTQKNQNQKSDTTAQKNGGSVNEKKEQERSYTQTDSRNTLYETSAERPEHEKNQSKIQEKPNADFRRWRQRACEDVKARNRVVRGFTSELIDPQIHMQITAALEECTTVEDVKMVFKYFQESEVNA